jgi:exosortase/archaeosortase family protein
VSVVLGTVPLGVACALIVWARPVRIVEAQLQRELLSWFGLHATRVGTTVIFPTGHRFYGVALSPGCSVGPVLAIFLAAVGVVAWFRRLAPGAVVGGVAVIVALFVVVNEIRIGIIVAAMHRWGFHRGYEISHVFVGSAISTTGFVIAVMFFVKIVLRRRPGAVT